MGRRPLIGGDRPPGDPRGPLSHRPSIRLRRLSPGYRRGGRKSAGPSPKAVRPAVGPHRSAPSAIKESTYNCSAPRAQRARLQKAIRSHHRRRFHPCSRGRRPRSIHPRLPPPPALDERRYNRSAPRAQRARLQPLRTPRSTSAATTAPPPRSTSAATTAPSPALSERSYRWQSARTSSRDPSSECKEHHTSTIGVEAALASRLGGMTRRKSSRLTGLVRKAFMPTARHSSFTPVRAWPVMAMMAGWFLS